MSLKEYIGSIVLEIDSQEIEITDLDVQINTGRKLVKTMNKTGRAKGFARGIATYELSVSAVIPDTNEPDWENLEGVKISLYPLSNSGKRTSYTITITELHPFRAGINRCGDRLYITDARWIWQVNVTGSRTPAYRFRTGVSAAGEPLLSFGAPVLEETFKDLKPAFTYCHFTYKEEQ
ncbi:DUF2313 domain-containing protein [Escherichia coli]|nr:DUF2313 domain-containing protein [Escherichia coli]